MAHSGDAKVDRDNARQRLSWVWQRRPELFRQSCCPPPRTVLSKYAEKYGEAKFIPQAVQDAVRQLDRTKGSIVQDKVATPPEPAKVVEDFVNALGPSYIVAERSTRGRANIAENYKSVFARFGDFNVQTGTDMTNQHTAWYLGMAFPFTLPRAVGGYDVPNQPRWRRPETGDPTTPRGILHGWLEPPVGLAGRK